MKNAIMVLANNMYFFELLVKNLPKTDLKDIQFIAINETRIGDKTDEIQKIYDKYNISERVKKASILTSRKIVDKFKKDVIDNSFVEEYCMSTKNLAHWYGIKYLKLDKMFVSDEDVIFRDGFSKVFESDHNMFMHIRLSAGPSHVSDLSDNAKRYYREFCKIFGYKLTESFWTNKYLKNYESAGNKLIVAAEEDIADYEKMMKAFYESEVLYEFWTNRRVHTSWGLDEKFETFYFINRSNKELRKYVHLILSAPEKFAPNYHNTLKKYAYLHNATRGRKPEVYEYMIKNGVIEGI